MAKRILGWVLLAHGAICLLGAFFPFYPPVFLFYGFFPGHFAVKLIIVLLAGASQVVYGGYLLLKNLNRGDRMSLMEQMVKQCRNPKGTFGRIMARAMNYGHSKVTRWGLSHVSISKDDMILDIGCGGGKTVNTLAKTATGGRIYGIDYSEDSVVVASKTNRKLIDAGRVKILHASVESLPFPDDYFDLVTAVESYYFFPDSINNLKEIRRVLKPGGSAILINAVYRHERFEKRNTKLARMGDFTYHSPEEFREFLREAGYSPIQIDVLETKNWIIAIGVKNGT